MIKSKQILTALFSVSLAVSSYATETVSILKSDESCSGESKQQQLYGYRAPTITTLSTVPATYTCGSVLSVYFSISAAFPQTNAFTVQLSDAAGNFTSPKVLGMGIQSPVNISSLPYAPAGSGYKIRVVSSTPYVVGTAIGPFTITPVVGATFANPINAGTLSCTTPFTDTRDNSSNCFGNDYDSPAQEEGQPSNDVYYKFTLAQPANITIQTCNSSVDTYIHFLTSNGSHFVSCDDNGPLCISTNKGSIVANVSNGTYYVVVETYGSVGGSFTLQIALPTALKFVDNTDRVELMDNSLLQLGTGPFTYEANVRIPAGHNTYVPILSNRTSGSPGNGFLFGINDQGKMAPQIGGTTYTAPGTTPNLYDSQCHHVALTRDASRNLKYYVDGALVYTQPSTPVLSVSAGNLRIGKDNFMSVNLNSWIWNVRVWNFDRTQADIQAWMSTMTYAQIGLIGQWPLYDASGQVAMDVSENQITGILGTTTNTETADPIWSCPACSGPLPPAPAEETTAIESSASISDDSELKVYPNPFSHETNVIITGKGGEHGVVEILDVNGAKIYKNENYIINETITLGENFHSGFYILRVTTTEGSKLLKLVKTE